MNGAIETREVYASSDVSITVTMYEDDTPVEGSFSFGDEADDEEYLSHFRNGDAQYVDMTVKVHYANAEICSQSLGGIEHGYLGKNDDGKAINADAWELCPPEYPEPDTVMEGSTLSSVIDEAIATARQWARAYGTEKMQDALKEAAQWIDPNNPEGWIV